MRVALLLTGNELMSGDTVDSNSAYMAQSLKDIGLVPAVKHVVGDDLPLLISSIKTLSASSDVLIVNGGLGPTVDDLTAVALSRATQTPLIQHPDALQHLQQWAAGFVLTESNLKQANLPDICDIIDNPNGSAVGFSCVHQNCLIICTPGVPSELKPMVENHVLALIKHHGGLHNDLQTTISRLRLFGITESGLQDMINTVFADWPAQVELGFRVQLPVIEIKLTTIGAANLSLNQQWTEKFRQHFSDYIIGNDDTRLTQALNQALRDKQQRIAVAESCTGGAIAAGITSEDGSSNVFEAGVVAYANTVKNQLLGVSTRSLDEQGAVSESVVKQMVSGVLALSGADIGLATSGIAGPTGGTADKPVGTVWIAWGSASAIKARRFFLPIGRVAFQRTATAIAMDLVRREVLGISTDVDYFAELRRQRVR